MLWTIASWTIRPIIKLGTGINNYHQSFTKIKYASLMGNVAARDFNGSETCKYDPDGHFVFNVAADETSMARNAGVGGVDRELVGTTMKGALYGAGLISLDLEDAIITDAHCDDLNLAWSNVINDNTKEIKIPTTSDLTILPADFLNVTAKSFEEICIPGNIQVIRTRAIYLAASNIRHIWTTGTKTLAEGEVDHTIYDNGAYLLDGKVMHKGHAGLDNTTWNSQTSTAVRYGTITLPPNLTLIESHAFKSDYISDVYSLNKTAPECHVDAFASVMYMGNNTINGDVNGMITRESYAVSTDEAKYIAFLHYPRECTTPDIQRYTDVTREYSVATTMRDGKGNVIYFPNQSELNRAYYQGMTGYLWYAWNSHRTPEFYNNANSFDEADISSSGGGFYHTTTMQQAANTLYINNTYTDPDKTDRSFYDVRLGGTEQPTEEKPSDLKWYYETIWEKKQLYPQMEATTTTEKIGEVQKEDENGNLLYKDCPGEGDYVKDFNYVEKSDGEYVKVSTLSGYESTNQPVEGVSSYYSDDQGATEATPKVGNGFYYVSGEHDVYTAVDKNNEAIGARDQYYTKNGDTYTESNLMFNSTYYYPTGNQVEKPLWGYVQGWNKRVSELLALSSEFYKKQGDEYVKFNPTLGNGPFYYYVDGSSDPVQTSTMVDGVTQYYAYQSWSTPNYQPVDPQISDEVYYPNGTEKVDEYLGSTYYIAGKDWYSYDQNNKTYTALTLNWYDHFTGDYYYVSGSAPTYTSAQGLVYDATATYYDVNGTEATSITFDQSYYYPVYAYSYEDYSGQAGDRYTKEYYYRLAENGETGDYCPDMDPVYAVKKEKQYDYRGWHQFILTAYATNDDRPITPVKFYQSDPDWWTVCLPYDLTYSEMVRFFGNGEGNIPYLSKLRYVVRDYDEQKITLMFSKNLMVYKEEITNPSITDDYVHGVIDDVTTYTEEELAADPIILHKGVPYLIKPNIPEGANRSFDVYKNELAENDLYDRLNNVQYLDAGALETMIYKGEYTVPAYVIGDNAPETTQASRDFEHAAGPTFTYNSADQITYGGKKVSAKISSDFSYTFVGSFFLSMMPQNCYFLGWDSKKKCAAFWYNRVPNPSSYDWNNQTGIICPNFNTDLTIDPATSLSDPARWIVSASDISNDDLVGSAGAKQNTLGLMDWGGSVDVVVSGIGQINVDNAQNKAVQEDVIYDLRGVRMNKPLSRLTKGVYIVNGKKYVVE